MPTPTRKAKKKAPAMSQTTPTPPEEQTPADIAETATTAAGGSLLSEIEQQCESLRTWHEEATAQLVTREQALDKLARNLDKQKSDQATEGERLAEAQAQLEADRDEIIELREELDAEWASVRTLRQAHEKLGKELDAERGRINRRAFKFPSTSRKAA